MAQADGSEIGKAPRAVSGDAGGGARPAPRSPRPVAAARRKVRSTPLGRVALWCAVAAATLHTAAVAWTWFSGSPGVRSGWLIWLDLPISLAYLHVMGERLLAWSLFAGGLQWAATGALLAWLVGRAARR